MADKEVIEGFNFVLALKGQGLAPGPRLVEAKNVRYVRALWPSFDRPTKLFTKDSHGLEIQGPPTPRNVIFPEGTAFLNTIVNRAPLMEAPRWEVTDIPTKADCFFVRTTERQMVEELQEVTEAMELGGVTQMITYKKPVMVEKEVEVITELTVHEARDMAEKD